MNANQTKSEQTEYIYEGRGPEIQNVVLSDGSHVYNVVIRETIHCLSEKHAIELVQQINKAVRKSAV